MKEKLLNYLVCPKCQSSFTLKTDKISKKEIKEGILKCTGCKLQYPIKDFIPRFVSKDFNMESFSFEWKLHSKTQMDTSKSKLSEKSFFSKTGWSKSDLKGKLVLDVGCGVGRYSDVASKQGAEVVGFDLSYSVKYAYENIGKRPNVHIVQADIFNMPFKQETFDYIFSIGVLHHTGKTKKSFFALPKYLKKGGKLGVWLYSNQNPVTMYSTKFWRIFTTRLPKRLFYALCYLSVPFYYVKKFPLFYPLILLMPTSDAKRWRERVLDTFDWYTPTFMTFHSYKEVFDWFKVNKFEVTHIGEPTAVSGIKR